MIRYRDMNILDELKDLSSYLSDIESELAIFFELSVDMLMISDRNGKVLKVSRSIEHILGYKPDEIVNQNALNLIHPEDRHIADEALQELRDGDLPRILTRWKNKFGDYRLISLASSRFKDNKTYSIGRDITDQSKWRKPGIEYVG